MTTNSLKYRMLRRMIGQFHRPHGMGGQVSGWVMAHRGANVQRNRWAVALLDVQPTDRVLEVGFGPGIALAELASRATKGHVYGIDHSALMTRKATKRNAAAIRAGRVELRSQSVVEPLSFAAPLDAILSVNSAGMWPDPPQRLRELRGLLRPGGCIALVSQPRCPGATAETTDRAARELRDLLTGAGFSHPRTEILPLTPPVACVLAGKP